MWVDGRGDLPGGLVVVSGPSGSGKSSLLRAVLADPGLNHELSVSATTRPPRPGEHEGRDYFFTTCEAFHTAVERDEFLEWAEYNGQSYGTPAGPVFGALAAGRSVILEIEVAGALQVRHHCPSALFVFLKTPTFGDLEARLRGRATETDAAILRRLRKAREELAEAHWYDVTLVNADFDRCVADLTRTLKNHAHAHAHLQRGSAPDA